MSTWSGVDGAIKLNNSILAPKAKISETKVDVSELSLVKNKEEIYDETKTVLEDKTPDIIEENTPIIEDDIKLKKEETIEEIIEETPEEKVEETIEEIVKTKPKIEPEIEPEKEPEIEPEKEPEIEIKKEPIIIKEEPKISTKNTKIISEIKQDFSSLESLILSLYEKVFNKLAPNFKPTFEQTVGDMLLYLSSKLKRKNLSATFDELFSLKGVEIDNKYNNNYIPLALQLSKWCKNKNHLDISEEILSLITYLYINSCKAEGVVVTELEIAIEFESEISYSIEE